MRTQLIVAAGIAASACGDNSESVRTVATSEGDVLIDLSRTERLPGPCAGMSVSTLTELRHCTFEYDDLDRWSGLQWSSRINEEEATSQDIQIQRERDAISSIEESGAVGDGECYESVWTFRDDGSTRVTDSGACSDLGDSRTTEEFLSDAFDLADPLDCMLLVHSDGGGREMSSLRDEGADGTTEESRLYTYDGEPEPGATVEQAIDISSIETPDGRDAIYRYTYDDQSRLVEVAGDDAPADGVVDAVVSYVFQEDRLVMIGSEVELVYDLGGNLVARIRNEALGPDVVRVMVYDYACWE